MCKCNYFLNESIPWRAANWKRQQMSMAFKQTDYVATIEFQREGQSNFSFLCGRPRSRCADSSCSAATRLCRKYSTIPRHFSRISGSSGTASEASAVLTHSWRASPRHLLHFTCATWSNIYTHTTTAIKLSWSPDLCSICLSSSRVE